MRSSAKSAAAKILARKRASKDQKSMAAMLLVASRKPKPPRVFGTSAQIALIGDLRSQLASIRDSTIEECARVAAGFYSEDNEVSKAIRALKDSTPREE